jgi:hypothetical protein
LHLPPFHTSRVFYPVTKVRNLGLHARHALLALILACHRTEASLLLLSAHSEMSFSVASQMFILIANTSVVVASSFRAFHSAYCLLPDLLSLNHELGLLL